jgi:hypothetical protein
MEHPWPYADTSPQATEAWIDLIRKMTPADKVRAVLRLTHWAMDMSKAGVRLMYPNADEREVFLRAASRRLTRDEMIRVYGWDPEADANRS